MNATPHSTGRNAEDLAARWLADRGWIVLARNFRDGPREIDLIGRHADVVAFIEVKARRSTRHHHPLDAIGPFKRRDLARAARRWIRLHGTPSDTYRFDAIAIVDAGSGTPTIEHVPDAWRL